MSSLLNNQSSLLLTLGKWLFILPFAVFGLLHFGPLEYSISYIPDFLPFKAFWVYFTGACLLAFTGSATLKKLDGLAAILLGVLLLSFVGCIHIPKALEGDFLGIVATFRDAAMAGAAFIYGATVAVDKRFLK